MAETPTVQAVAAHQIPDRQPLILEPGDAIEVGERDVTWPAFVFVTSAKGEGWVPSRHLDINRGVVQIGYDTTELPTSIGEALEVVERDDESGWLWCRNSSGEEGWVPVEGLAPIGD